MGGGHTNHCGVLKSAEMNNRNKEEERLEKEKRDRKVMEIHETDALKVLEHVTKRGYQYINTTTTNCKCSLFGTESIN